MKYAPLLLVAMTAQADSLFDPQASSWEIFTVDGYQGRYERRDGGWDYFTTDGFQGRYEGTDIYHYFGLDGYQGTIIPRRPPDYHK